MKNEDRWKPTKYELHNGRWRGSRSAGGVGLASRRIADLVAFLYSEAIPKFASGRLLDLGAGTAPLYGIYRPHVDEIVCVDWDMSLHSRNHLDFEADLKGVLPFDDGLFETIILSDVLEHIPTPATLWSEMQRILAPGGCVILNVPFFYGLHEEPHDFFRYTEFCLRRLASESGFTTVDLNVVGGKWESLGDLSAKIIIKLPFAGRALVRSLQFVLESTACLRAQKSKDVQRFPLGYFMVAKKLQ